MHKKISKSTISSSIIVSLIVTGAVAVANFATPSSWAMTMQQGNQIGGGNMAKGTAITNPVQLKLALRDLWVDHIVYTRNYIISFVAGLPDANLIAQRLLKNQEDLGNAIKPFYGEQAGNKLTDLLKGHILGAVDILKAAKAGNSTTAAQKKWYNNAEEITTFLSTANPNWSRTDLKTMLDNHLNLTLTEAVDILSGKYSDGIAAFDKVHQQAVMMSDALADGIIKQFPDKFSSSTTTNTGTISSSSPSTGVSNASTASPSPTGVPGVP